MTFDFSFISVVLQSIAVAVVIVLAVFAWRWLRVAIARAEVEQENAQLALLATYAKRFVGAAEQTMAKQPGFARLDWVLAQLDDVLPGLDKGLIRSFVEDFVREIPAADPPKPPKLAAPPATGTAGYVTTTTQPPEPAAPSHSHRATRAKVGTEG